MNKKYPKYTSFPFFHTPLDFIQNGLPLEGENYDTVIAAIRKIEEGGAWRFKKVDNHAKVAGWLEILTKEEAQAERSKFKRKDAQEEAGI